MRKRQSRDQILSANGVYKSTQENMAGQNIMLAKQAKVEMINKEVSLI